MQPTFELITVQRLAAFLFGPKVLTDNIYP